MGRNIKVSIITSLLISSAVADLNITTIATGSSHVVALEANGSIFSWGSGANGRLASGTTTNSYIPIEANTTTATGFSRDLNITAITTGATYTIALEANGSVLSFGGNQYGQLGDGTTIDRYYPVEANTTTATGFSSDLNITAIASGAFFTTALNQDGTVWAWGYNNNGELGDGTNTDRSTPVQVSNLSNITSIASGYNDTMALKSDGTLWAWGRNNSGQLGDGTTTSRNTPVQVHTTIGSGFSTDLNITSVEGSGLFTVALEANGTLWAWGLNNRGQLGDGTTTDRSTPVQVHTTIATGFSTDLNITAIAVGSGHTVALEANGSVWSWGTNEYGQFGDGNDTNSSTPVEANLSTSKGWYYDANITKVFASENSYYTVAIDTNGTIIGWGANSSGQLESNDTTNKYTPIIIGTEPFNIKETNTLTESISWNSFYSVNKFSIYRGESLSGPFTKVIDAVENNATTFSDSTASYNKDYYYIVSASYDQFGTFTEANSSATKVDFNITLPTVTTSSGVIETDTTIKSDINWTNSELNNISATKIYYKKSSDSTYTTISSTTTNSTIYTLTGLIPATSYSVIVGETNSSIGELNSTTYTFTTRHTPPYNLSASGTTTTSTTLSWSDGSFGNSVDTRKRMNTTTYYRIYKDGVVLTQSLPSSTTSYQATGLSPSTTYSFFVSEYGTVANRERDVSQENEYNSTAISVTTLTPEVQVQTSLITSNVDSTTKDDAKVKQEENQNSYINSADLTTPDGKGTKVVLETPKEGSDITSKTLTLEYTDTDTAKTTLITDKDVDVTVNIDGSFTASKSFEDKKVIANGDSKGDTSIDIENANSKQNINIPKGADVKIENNIAKATHTIKAETKQSISDMSVEIEADPTKSVKVVANYTNNGKEESTTYITPSDVIEAKVDFIPANENGTYSGITAIIKTTNNLSFSENQRGLRTTTILDPNTTTIVGTSAWQKYDERVYFDGRRTVTLLLGSANILRDAKEETMIQGVEYELVPSTNTDTTTTTNSDLIANENSLTQIYTNSYLNIREGWNLISNPISEPLDIEGVFKYATSSFKYQNGWINNPKEVNQNEGIWINYTRHISEKIEGDSYYSDFTNTTSGWNLFGAGRDIDLNELNSFSEIWVYDSKFKEWVKNPSIIYRGYGFWAK